MKRSMTARSCFMPSSSWVTLIVATILLLPPLSDALSACGNNAAPAEPPSCPASGGEPGDDCDTGNCTGSNSGGSEEDAECGEESEAGSSDDCEGANPFRAYTANGHRPVKDLEVFGGVGTHRLAVVRYGNTRFTGGPQWFGQGGNWRHSYQWEMADTTSDNQGRARVMVFFPTGGEIRFTEISAGQWVPEARYTARLFHSGNLYTLRTRAGFDYEFSKTGGQYRLERFIDVHGNVGSSLF